MSQLFRLSADSKADIIEKLKPPLEERREIRFACLHGSFNDHDLGFRDIDIGVWVDPDAMPREAVLKYGIHLNVVLERLVHHPVDVTILNYTSIGFKHAVSGGLLLTAKDMEEWYDFRERTWNEYLDFVPFLRQSLFDLGRP
jgi:predicted nucleotidyltransferase